MPGVTTNASVALPFTDWLCVLCRKRWKSGSLGAQREQDARAMAMIILQWLRAQLGASERFNRALRVKWPSAPITALAVYVLSRVAVWREVSRCRMCCVDALVYSPRRFVCDFRTATADILISNAIINHRFQHIVLSFVREVVHQGPIFDNEGAESVRLR